MPLAWKIGGEPAMLICYAAALVAWVLFAKVSRPLPLVSTLLVAAALRLLMFAHGPDLSGDVFRYLWDGRILASGRNPYSYTPDDPDLIALRESWHSRINHPGIPTIYPPWAQLSFLVSALAGGTLLSWRLLLLAADLATITILHRIKPAISLAWAAFPLVIVEGFWSGHVEILGITAIVAAWHRLGTRRDAGSGALFGVAVGVKVVPLFALPAMIRDARRRKRWVAAFAAALTIPAIAFMLSGGFMPGLGDYATRWSFNSPVYSAVRGAMVELDVAERLKAVWTAIKDPLRAEPISDFVYQQIYPDMVARVVLGLAIVGALAWIVLRIRATERAIAWSVSLGLLLSPAIHPWYWLTALPFALAARERLIVLLAAFSPCSYLLYRAEPPAGLVWAVCYAIPLAIELALRRFERRSSFEDGDAERQRAESSSRS